MVIINGTKYNKNFKCIKCSNFNALSYPIIKTIFKRNCFQNMKEC